MRFARLFIIVGMAVTLWLSSSRLRAIQGDQAQIDEIRKLEVARLEAGVRKDTTAVAGATADSYLQIDLDGNVLDKAQALRRIASTYARLQSNPVDEMTIRIFGNTAIVTGRSMPQGIINDEQVRVPIRYSRVYVKTQDRWQVVMFQQTRVSTNR